MDITCDYDTSDKREEYEVRSKMHSFDGYCLQTKCVFHLYICNTDELKTLNNTYWKKKNKRAMMALYRSTG